MEDHDVVGGTTPAPARPRVLVVDDDPAIRLICTTWLSLDGYEVIEAANGQDALDIAFTEMPAVVLLDLSMPVLDGFAVAAALRADDADPRAPARRPHRRDRRETSPSASSRWARPASSRSLSIQAQSPRSSAA